LEGLLLDFEYFKFLLLYFDIDELRPRNDENSFELLLMITVVVVLNVVCVVGFISSFISEEMLQISF
jgi:hypothetical protein